MATTIYDAGKNEIATGENIETATGESLTEYFVGILSTTSGAWDPATIFEVDQRYYLSDPYHEMFEVWFSNFDSGIAIFTPPLD